MAPGEMTKSRDTSWRFTEIPWGFNPHSHPEATGGRSDNFANLPEVLHERQRKFRAIAQLFRYNGSHKIDLRETPRSSTVRRRGDLCMLI